MTEIISNARLPELATDCSVSWARLSAAHLNNIIVFGTLMHYIKLTKLQIVV